MSYYDIDAILTDAEKIPCEFQIDVPELGYLDNSPSHGLKAGARVNLPLWLAEMLALANTSDPNDPRGAASSFASLNLPSPLADEVVQALKADPRSVPLRDRSPHFYALAVRILDLFEERDLAAVLRRSFVVRAADVGLHARKAGGASAAAAAAGGGGGGGGVGTAGAKKDEGSNVGLGGVSEEFLRGLDEWERALFRMAHDGTKAGHEWMDAVKRR
ncbi:hypothetical protein GGTG_02154 [Gaeumannomyces tritici R3-111a-1]|uniref:DNA replication complex GINS protein PSF3 n=1 Tax=Gaeumannomyces tritici (strain R3-111a-1) TaxID=644352 RepID=J3NLK5_GAET3|nr:hypothetical protein GGTG_02154 [Gaeumannomyces tritici R3-111a-1]EJT82180.1 hypothetical protein GGTG_02154 [Gaeumannomyces tritici R3-111a-1]